VFGLVAVRYSAIRSAEADTIAGITDPAHAVNDPTTAPSASDSLPIGWGVLGIGVLGLLAAACAWWILRRRRGGLRAHPSR